MTVSQLTVDPITSMPIVILRDDEGRLIVPVWIGVQEASAIASQLEKVELSRPVAHDLMKTIIGECGLVVSRIEILDVKEHTYFAAIVLGRGPEHITLDARPSDAIALALRTGAPIRVSRKVIDKTRKLGIAVAIETEEARKGVACGGDLDVARAGESDLLGLLSDEDFGKWKM